MGKGAYYPAEIPASVTTQIRQKLPYIIKKKHFLYKKNKNPDPKSKNILN